MAESASFESTSIGYDIALNTALNHFRSLLSSSSSRSWKPLPPSIPSSYGDSVSLANAKGKVKELLNGVGAVDPVGVRVHRRTSKGADIVRAVTEVAVGEGVDLESFKAVLQTPEVRSAWDKLVEHAHVVELVDPQTRVSKTDYRLGWPASPRDTITISKTFSDSTTLIDISTSLPRSADEPAFLRPAPPYVRSHVHLLSWCVQLLPSSPSSPPNARITVFWQWSLKGAVFATHHQQIAQQLSGFVDYVREKGDQIPLVAGYGRGLEMGSTAFDRGQDTLQVEYTIIADDDVEAKAESAVKGMDELAKQKERRRLERAIELSLSASQGWAVSVVVKGQGEGVDTAWTAAAEAVGEGRVTLRIAHAKVVKVEQLVKVRISIQRLAGGKVLKVNGETTKIVPIEPRNPSSLSRQMLEDTASVGSPSIATASTSDSPTGPSSSSISTPIAPLPSTSEVMSLLRRNYIYFTSLLQEPEAKWRHVSDSQGVTVTQLNSIDPTLTIYRAEATFVGVGVWDVLSTICTPGARMEWDKGLEEATLLEDINELSSLWHIKTKAAWPVAPRDSVTVQTAYKSPSSVHIFSFSTDDDQLFPSIPPLISPTIRTQTDLYGWAIEALSPTTTQITLLDQSDPKGWSNKSWTPTQMVKAVAGVGAFSVKCGGPPVVTRLLGAKGTLSKYDHDKGTLKFEYKAATTAPSTVSLAGDDFEAAQFPLPSNGDSSSTIECEIRCDSNTWAASIDIVIDPPPAKVSCLSRHRLSSGGGLWITIEHDSIVVGDDRLLVLVRKGSGGREKGSVTVNGAKLTVDVEMLPEDEVKLLSKRKRVKASPIPLDQYPTHGPRIWRTTPSPSGRSSPSPSSPAATTEEPPKASVAQSSPLAQVPTTGSATTISEPSSPLATKPPLLPPGHALEALSWLQTFHAEQGPELADPAPGWAIVSERAGTVVRKKIVPRVSEVLPVYRGDKIVQGLTADEIASVVSAVGCRKAWDERVETATPLATYGHGCSTAVLTTKPTFPFKGRILHVASVNAQVRVPSASAASSTSTVLFCASSSYTPDETFDDSKVNPGQLLPGQVLLEGWILETLDPYTSSMLAIPSTRCTYIACVDHSGSVPLALNSVLNANLARLINSVESLGKTKGPLPRVWKPDAGLQIEGPLNDEGDQECVWKLNKVDSSSVLLSADFAIEDGTFRSLFRVNAPPIPSAPPPTLSTSKSHHSLAVPTPSLPVGTILKSELPRSASLNFGSPPHALMLQRPPDLAHKSSKSSLREASRSKSPTKDATPGTDFVVAELVVDLKQFPHGYSIACSSSLVSPDLAEPLSLEPLRSLAARQVPLYATAHDAPLPPIVSASLDSWKRHNHLVRILVPTAAITHPVQDPLREGKTKPVPPEWFRRLVERGAVVEVRIVPLPMEGGDKGAETRVMFNGESLAVVGQKESRGVLSRIEDEDWHPNGAEISRVARKGKKDNDAPPSTLPQELLAPVAVAVRLLAPKISTPTMDDSEFPDPKSPGAVMPNDEEKGSKSPLVGSKAGPSLSGYRREASLSDAANGPLAGLLGAYPLSRLSSTMTTTSPITDDPSTSNRRTYTLSFVVLVAVISFLLGSLLRSLLTPADYIIYTPSEGKEVERVLMQAFDTGRRWREARRLLEVRSFFFSQWDLIFAAVKRG